MYDDNNRTGPHEFLVIDINIFIELFFFVLFLLLERNKKKIFRYFGVCVEYNSRIKIMFGILCNDQTTHRD